MHTETWAMIDIRTTLKQAAEAYKSGDKATAQRLCLDILTVDPTHPDTLFLSSFLTDVPARQVTLLQMALERDPNHVRSRSRLAKLTAEASLPAAHVAPSSPQTPAFSAPITSVPPRPAPVPASSARPPIAPLPIIPLDAKPKPGLQTNSARRRGAGATLLMGLLAIVLVVVAAGVALTLLSRRDQGTGVAGTTANIVVVTRTPTATLAPSETPAVTSTPVMQIVSVATVPASARTGPGSRNEPVPLGAPFPLTRDGTPVLTLRIDDVIRGEEAARRLTQASPLNPEPASGYEYLLLRVVARLDPDAERAQINAEDFVGFSGDALHPIDAEFIYPPPPELNTSFGSPGSETSGWVVVSVPAGDPAPLVQFSSAQWPDGIYFATAR
jgi:hypothetical protein